MSKQRKKSHLLISQMHFRVFSDPKIQKEETPEATRMRLTSLPKESVTLKATIHVAFESKSKS